MCRFLKAFILLYFFAEQWVLNTLKILINNFTDRKTGLFHQSSIIFSHSLKFSLNIFACLKLTYPFVQGIFFLNQWNRNLLWYVFYTFIIIVCSKDNPKQSSRYIILFYDCLAQFLTNACFLSPTFINFSYRQLKYRSETNIYS